MIIITGGQTGVDRAAWDVALELGFEIGGWVPKGRWAEDGPISAKYSGVRETDSADPAERTKLNVRDSNATLIISNGHVTGGSQLALNECKRLDRPIFHLDLTGKTAAEGAAEIREWLKSLQTKILNVAGPRASEDGTIGEVARAVLREAFRP